MIAEIQIEDKLKEFEWDKYKLNAKHLDIEQYIYTRKRLYCITSSFSLSIFCISKRSRSGHSGTVVIA